MPLIICLFVDNTLGKYETYRETINGKFHHNHNERMPLVIVAYASRTFFINCAVRYYRIRIIAMMYHHYRTVLLHLLDCPTVPFVNLKILPYCTHQQIMYEYS